METSLIGKVLESRTVLEKKRGRNVRENTQGVEREGKKRIRPQPDAINDELLRRKSRTEEIDREMGLCPDAEKKGRF